MKSRRHSLQLTTISQNGSLIVILSTTRSLRRKLRAEAPLSPWKPIWKGISRDSGRAPRLGRSPPAPRVPARCSPSGGAARPRRSSAPPLPAPPHGHRPADTESGTFLRPPGKGLISALNSFPPARRWGRAHARCYGCPSSTQKVAGEGRGEGAEPPAGAESPRTAALTAAAQSPTCRLRLAAGGRKGINFKLGRAGGQRAAWMCPSLGADSQPAARCGAAAARGARGAAAPLPPPPAMGRGVQPGP